MKKIAIFLSAAALLLMAGGCGLASSETGAQPAARPPATSEKAVQKETNPKMRINVTANGKVIVYQLNSSRAAKELYAQLPLTAEVKNFSNNEKVFYPPKKLNTADTPLADAGKDTLAYYAPWGDVVLFYAPFGKGSGLYALGEAVSGKELVEALSGTVEIAAAN